MLKSLYYFLFWEQQVIKRPVHWPLKLSFFFKQNFFFFCFHIFSLWTLCSTDFLMLWHTTWGKNCLQNLQNLQLLNYCAVRMIVVDLLPFSFTEEVGFPEHIAIDFKYYHKNIFTEQSEKKVWKYISKSQVVTKIKREQNVSFQYLYGLQFTIKYIIWFHCALDLSLSIYFILLCIIEEIHKPLHLFLYTLKSVHGTDCCILKLETIG